MKLDDGRLWVQDQSLIDRYGTVLLDLDGVVYLLGEPIEGACESLERLRQAGCSPVFVTNNASRRASTVADLLTAKGIKATAEEVVTSARTAAVLLAEHCEPGSAVLVVGAEALVAEVAEVGLKPVTKVDGKLAAVVQGYGPTTGWLQLAEAVVAVRSGAFWVATNTDATMPSPRGPLPGNGTMVAAVATALGREPDVVAGKPSPVMLRQAVAAHPGREAIMVGDRWDTDIAGARAADVPGLLVLSGTTTPRQVLDIPASSRPQYLAWTVSGLTQSHPEVRMGAHDQFACRDWQVTIVGRKLELSGQGEALDALRVLAQAAWWSNDRDESGVSVSCHATSKAARQAQERLGV